MRFEVLLTYAKSHDLAVVRESLVTVLVSFFHPLCTGEAPVLSGEPLDLPLERTPPFVHREDPRAKW